MVLSDMKMGIYSCGFKLFATVTKNMRNESKIMLLQFNHVTQDAKWLGREALLGLFARAWSYPPLKGREYEISLTLRIGGTEGRTRTGTVLPPPDFESGASTSFATSASGR